MSTYQVKLRIKVKCMMQTKCCDQRYPNKVSLFTSSIFRWLAPTVHLHTNFKHIFVLWLLYKNHSRGTSEAFFLQFGTGVIPHRCFSFGCYSSGISFSTLCKNCLWIFKMYSKLVYECRDELMDKINH